MMIGVFYQVMALNHMLLERSISLVLSSLHWVLDFLSYTPIRQTLLTFNFLVIDSLNAANLLFFCSFLVATYVLSVMQICQRFSCQLDIVVMVLHEYWGAVLFFWYLGLAFVSLLICQVHVIFFFFSENVAKNMWYMRDCYLCLACFHIFFTQLFSSLILLQSLFLSYTSVHNQWNTEMLKDCHPTRSILHIYQFKIFYFLGKCHSKLCFMFAWVFN